MVSEGDLLHRTETGTERSRAWWLEMLASTNQLAGDYVKSHSGVVKDVMTRNVISVSDTTPIADIAVLLETNRIKRVPVLRDGKLVGIVSRANLVRALAMTINQPSTTEADDRTIRDKLLAELKAQKWAEVSPANVTVKDGVVHLWSSYYSDRRSGRSLSPPKTSQASGGWKTTCGRPASFSARSLKEQPCDGSTKQFDRGAVAPFWLKAEVSVGFHDKA